MLHPQMTCVLQSVSSPTTLANVVILRFEMVLPLRHRSIMALYPHMTNNSIFLEKTMGKSLVLDVVKTFHFNEKNKVVQLSAGYDMLQPWFDLLQDMEMAVEVIAGCKLKTCLIDMDYLGIEKAIDFESKQKLLEVASACRRGRPRIDEDYTDIEPFKNSALTSFSNENISPELPSLSLHDLSSTAEECPYLPHALAYTIKKNKANISFILG